MKIDTNHPEADKVMVLDFMDKQIKCVKSFDTETNIAEIYVPCGDKGYVVIRDLSDPVETHGKLLTLEVHLPGARLVYKDTGLPVEPGT